MPPTPSHAAMLDPHTIASLADVALRAAEVIAVPKAADPDSFVLHAPLELMARVGLVPLVDPARRHDALGMIEWLAAEYAAAGDPVDPPARSNGSRPVASLDLAAAADRLGAAVVRGDVVEVDRLAPEALSSLAPAEVAGRLGESIVPSLSAAGHAPIGLALLARVRPMLSASLLHGALRTIASRPDWQVSWHLPVEGADGGACQEGGAARPNDIPAALHAALVATPHLGRPGSDFIFPLMSQVQDGGHAAALLGPLLADRYDTRAVGAVLTRVAAWSMVHDDPEQAPYGWSHALTMPQAVMALAGAGVRPRTALAVAGTFAVGFRAAHGTMGLPAAILPEDGTEWLRGVGDPSWQDLATAAALHHDAHLAKHTLAARHAAADDPAFADLYRSAAARLVRWWGA